VLGGGVGGGGGGAQAGCVEVYIGGIYWRYYTHWRCILEVLHTIGKLTRGGGAA